MLNFPVEAAVQSVLPLCRRFVFAVGRSDDDTRQRIAAIDTSMMNQGRGGTIDIVDTQWPDVMIDGTVLAIEANKALDAAQATGCTWGFYIQADEVIHEDDLPILDWAMRHYQDQPQVKALLFWYHHFVLDYQTTDPWMYHKACRIMRLDGSCQIFGDACGPGLKDYTGTKNDGYLDKRHLGAAVRWAKAPSSAGVGRGPARVFHYGWVKRKDELDAKMRTVEKLWWGTLDKAEKERRKQNKFGRFVDRYPALKKFRGTHPAVMAERVANHPPFARVPSRWLNPRFYAEVLRHGFHG